MESKILFNPFLINLFEIALMAGHRTHGQTKRAFCRVKFVGFVILLFARVLSFNVALPITQQHHILFARGWLENVRTFSATMIEGAVLRAKITSTSKTSTCASQHSPPTRSYHFVLTFSKPMQCDNQKHQQKLKTPFF